MTKLPIHDVSFTIGARLGDSLACQALAKGSLKEPLLHSLKGLASLMQGTALYGVVWINGTGYATK